MWERLETNGDAVRRRGVPGGWLYQVEDTYEHHLPSGEVRYVYRWSAPVFVPAAKE